MVDARHVLVTGRTGSGKTSLVRTMTYSTPRVIYLDILGDYTDGEVISDFRTATRYYMDRRGSDFRIIFRGKGRAQVDREAMLSFLRLVQRVQSEENGREKPVGIVLEESGVYSTSYELPDILHDLYLYGRRWGVALLTVVQRDVQVHPIVRANSQLVVSMSNLKLSSDLAQFFDLSEIATLDVYNTHAQPKLYPVYGKHYVTYPPDIDPVGYWEDTFHGPTKGE